MTKRLISLITAIGIMLSISIMPSYAATSNSKQNFYNTIDGAYYSLERFEEARTTLVESEQAGIGKVFTVSTSGQTRPPNISHYWAFTPVANAPYFAFMYCYEGTDTQSDMIYTIAQDDSAYTKSTTLKGDGKWRVGVWDFSDVVSNLSAKNIKWFQHLYAMTEGCYNYTYKFANYNIFRNNPQITSIDKSFSPVVGEMPDTDTATNGNYTINYIEWYNEDGSILEGVFERDKKYTMEMSLTANENYFFTDEGWDFENANSTEVKSIDSYLYENTIVLSAEFDTKNLQIEHISIENGSQNVNPATEKIDISFNKQIKTDTFDSSTVIIEPEIDWYAEFTGESNASIVFDGTLATDTPYTVTFTEGIEPQNGLAMQETVLNFRTAVSYPKPQFVESSVENGEKNISDEISSIDVKFDLGLKTSTLNKTNITVVPAVSYSVSPIDKGFRINFPVGLQRETQYTISWNDSIMSSYETCVDSGNISFTTVPEFKNMIKNGDMEYTDDTNMFNDAQSNTLIKYTKEDDGNTVLKWTSKWDTAPVGSYVDWIPGHTYYISVRVKSDRDAVIYFDPHYRHSTGSYHQAGNKNVTANEWTTITAQYTIPTDKLESGTIFDDADTIRVVIKTGGAVVLIDDWKMYDMTLAPQGRASVISAQPQVGATEVSPFDAKAVLEFNVPINPNTIKNITSSPSAIKSVELADNLTTCTIYFNELNVNTAYMVTVPETVKTMYGESARQYMYRFETYTVPNVPLQVSNTSIADNEQKASLYNAFLDIEFDSYVDTKTLTAENVRITPDIVKEIKPSPKGVKLVFDNERIAHDTQYTVTLSGSIKNLTGNALVPYEMSFKTKSKADIVSSFNAAETVEQMASFMENEYADLMVDCDAYYKLLETHSSLTDSLYTILLDSNAPNDSDLSDIVSKKTMYTIAADGNTDEIKMLIESDILGLKSKDVFNIYKDIISEENKTELYNNISEKTISINDDIPATIAEQIVLFAIGKANGWETVRDILQNSKELFVEDMETLLRKVNNLSLPSKAYVKLQNYTADDLSDIYNQLNAAYGAAMLVPSLPSAGEVSSAVSSMSSKNPSVIVDKELQPQEPFSDLSNVKWAKDSIESFYEKGIISGKGNKRFAPFDNITREEFVKMFVLSTSNYDKNAVANFGDVEKNHWSASYIASAVQCGLINGTKENVFGLGTNITREDIAVIIYRYINGKNVKTVDKAEFADFDTASEYAKAAITFLQRAGIANGDDTNNYYPKNFSTRAEAVVLLDRLLQVCAE